MRLRMLSAIAALCAAALPCLATAQATVPVIRTTLEAAGNVGAYNDVVARPDGTALVAYTGDAADTIRAASCQDAACTAATAVTVDTGGPFAHVAAAIGADGLPVLAYQHLPTASVRLALCADAACTSAVLRTVDALGSLTPRIGVAVGGDGQPVVVYGGAAATGVTVAHCDDAACTTFTRTPYPASQQGVDAAAVTGSDGLVLFAAKDGIDVTVSHCTTAACTSASTVRIVGTFLPDFQRIYSRPSLALGANGLVEIATETSAVQGPSAAVLASHHRCANVGCTSLALGGAFQVFASEPALAVLPDGNPVVTYEATNLGLHLVRCREADCFNRDTIPLDGGADTPSSVAVTAGGVVLASYHDDVDGDLEVAAVAPYSHVSISTPVELPEGNSGTTLASFEVARTDPGGTTFVVDFATVGITATSGTDFLPVSGTLTFAPGELVRTIAVPVVGDLAFEEDEAFRVELTNPQGGVLLNGFGIGRILNDDAAPPPLTIFDTTVVEGNLGTTTAVFQVTFGGTNGASVGFFTVAQTATAGVDYLTTSGTVTFAPGETVRQVQVPVVGDLGTEANETFRVQLQNPQGGTVTDFAADATILDDDGDPASLSIGDVTVTEGDAGTAAALFTVSLSPPSATPVLVNFATQDQTASAGADYVAASGSLSFAPGATARVVTVSVIADLDDEPDETFRVLLSNAQGALLADGEGIGTILDDDLASEAPIPGELRHGASYAGDLAAIGVAADVDDFRLLQDPYASYEVMVDAISGDAVPFVLERRDAGASVVQSGTPVGTGTARSLRWRVAGTAAVSDQAIRVAGACGVACGTDDVYRVRAYETTLRGTRFNNSGTQTTVIVLQNPGDTPIVLDVRFWDLDGTLLAMHTPAGPLAPHGVLVLNTAGIVPRAAGSVTVAHDAPYGGLVGKSVAIEPSTGLAFDTPLEPRPR